MAAQEDLRLPGKNFKRPRINKAFCEGQQFQAAGGLRAAAPQEPTSEEYEAWICGWDEADNGNYYVFCGFSGGIDENTFGDVPANALTTIAGDPITTIGGDYITTI